MPKSNLDYWNSKITGNLRRDKQVNKLLRKKGWQVLRIWEHSLKSPSRVATRLRRLLGRDDISAREKGEFR